MAVKTIPTESQGLLSQFLFVKIKNHNGIAFDSAEKVSVAFQRPM